MGTKLCKPAISDSLENYDNKCQMFTLEGQEHRAKVVNIPLSITFLIL